MNYQEIALEVFNNKLNYNDNDYIIILNILMESYNKSKGIPYEINMDLKQEEVIVVCDACNVPAEDLGEELKENLCFDCYEMMNQSSDNEDIE